MIQNLRRSVLAAAALIMFALPALAVPTSISSVVPKSPNAGSVSAGAAQVDGTAGDASNGNKTILADGKLYLMFINTHASNAYTVDITSVADDLGRTADIEGYSIPAGKVAIFGPFTAKGWAQGAGANSGTVVYTVEDAAVKVAPLVVR